jgi:hypothetical protein
MAPMIDVVFLLLVYFMVATDFSPAEEVFRLDLPAAAAAASPLDLQEAPLRVQVLPGPEGGPPQVTVEGPWSDLQTPDELRVFLAGAVVPRGDLFLADHPIIIVPGPETPWSQVIDTFNAVVAGGCTNVTLESSL